MMSGNSHVDKNSFREGNQDEKGGHCYIFLVGLCVCHLQSQRI